MTTPREHLPSPTPAAIRQARDNAGLSQAQAAKLISAACTSPYRTWQSYEANADTANHRSMPLASWEMFLLLTNQHPRLILRTRTDQKIGALEESSLLT
jgi:hypothetical protein